MIYRGKIICANSICTKPHPSFCVGAMRHNITVAFNTINLDLLQVNEMAATELKNRKSAKPKLNAANGDGSDGDF